MHPTVTMERFHKYSGPILGITMDCGHEFILTEPMTRWFREQIKKHLKDEDGEPKRKYFPSAKPGSYCTISFDHVVAGIGIITVQTKPLGLGGQTVTHEVFFYYRALADLLQSPMEPRDAYYNGRKVGKGEPANRKERVLSTLTALDPKSR